MKPALLLATAVLMMSCTQYQYMTVSGVNLPKNERNELVSETDTLRVEYRFGREKGLVSVRIYNKTAAPLEIEWRKSAIIVNDQTVGYYSPNQLLVGNVQTTAWRTSYGETSSTGTINGEVQSGEQVQFIPPKSYVESRPLRIPFQPLTNFPDEKAEKNNFRGAEAMVVTYKRFPFDNENSPTRFRSYLTLKIGKEAEQQEFSVEHRFYISEVWKTASGPELFAGDLLNRGDRFYLLP